MRWDLSWGEKENRFLGSGRVSAYAHRAGVLEFWISVSIIEKTFSVRCPGHFYWKTFLIYNHDISAFDYSNHVVSTEAELQVDFRYLRLLCRCSSLFFKNCAKHENVLDHGNHTENIESLNLKLTLLRKQEVALFHILVNLHFYCLQDFCFHFFYFWIHSQFQCAC